MPPNTARLLERELPHRQLKEALKTARAGCGRIVSLEGEAGIGRTSLALSFVEAHRSDAGVYIGGCEHLATLEPVGPLQDIERESQGRFSVSATSLLTTYESLLRLHRRRPVGALCHTAQRDGSTCVQAMVDSYRSGSSGA